MAEPSVKVMTIRLPAELAEELEIVARVDDRPIVEAIRVAIAEYTAARRADTAFRRRVRARIEADYQILQRFAEGGATSDHI